jgi:hypothetical protein
MNSLVTYFVVVLVIGLSTLRGRVEAQETIISKKDADFVFNRAKPQWEQDSQRFFAPGQSIRTTKHETGTSIMAMDPSTGITVTVQPFYRNDKEPPDIVIIGNYFPIGVLPPMTDELKKDMEAAAQKDLGPMYSVRLIYSLTGEKEARALGLTTRIEVIEFVLSRKK